MAVENLYYCSRDGKDKAFADPENKMFTDKKQAEERDRYLELIEELTYYVSQRASGLDEGTIEQVSEVIAANKDHVAKGLKKPQSLNAQPSQSEEAPAEAPTSNVASLNG